MDILEAAVGVFVEVGMLIVIDVLLEGWVYSHTHSGGYSFNDGFTRDGGYGCKGVCTCGGRCCCGGILE